MGQADATEYEGGDPDSITPVVPASQQPRTFTAANGLRITIPARQPLASATATRQPLAAVGSNTGPASDGMDGIVQEDVEDAPIATGAAAPRVPPSRFAGRQGKENEPSGAPVGTQTRGGRTTKPPRNPDAADPETLRHAMNARVSGATAPKETAPKPAKRKAKDAAFVQRHTVSPS